MIKKLTSENIYNLIDQESVMSYYFGELIIINKKYKNPLRDDRKPTCFFKYANNGVLLFIDNSRNEYTSDCIKFVKLKYNLTQYEAMEKINSDFKLGLGSNTVSLTVLKNNVVVENKEKRIVNTITFRYLFKVVLRNYNKVDSQYWSKYHISKKMLLDHDIYPVKMYYQKKEDESFYELKYTYDKNIDDPCYVYKIEDINNELAVKLYQPLTKNSIRKWKSNTSVNHIQGYHQLIKKGDSLFIMSSMKDLLCMKVLGYTNCIAPNSEGVIISKNIIDDLTERFKTIYVLYDSDDAGIKYTNKFIEKYPHCIPLFVPLNDNYKDVADMVRYEGIVKSQQIINDCIRVSTQANTSIMEKSI